MEIEVIIELKILKFYLGQNMLKSIFIKLNKNPMKAKTLSPTILKHVLMWATHCSRSENYRYTKWDANIAILIKNEIKRLYQVQHFRQKHLIINLKENQDAKI